MRCALLNNRVSGNGGNDIPFQIAVHNGEEDLKEEVHGIDQHRKQVQPRFSQHVDRCCRMTRETKKQVCLFVCSLVRMPNASYKCCFRDTWEASSWYSSGEISRVRYRLSTVSESVEDADSDNEERVVSSGNDLEGNSCVSLSRGGWDGGRGQKAGRAKPRKGSCG